MKQFSSWFRLNNSDSARFVWLRSSPGQLSEKFDPLVTPIPPAQYDRMRSLVGKDDGIGVARRFTNFKKEDLNLTIKEQFKLQSNYDAKTKEYTYLSKDLRHEPEAIATAVELIGFLNEHMPGGRLMTYDIPTDPGAAKEFLMYDDGKLPEIMGAMKQALSGETVANHQLGEEGRKDLTKVKKLFGMGSDKLDGKTYEAIIVLTRLVLDAEDARLAEEAEKAKEVKVQAELSALQADLSDAQKALAVSKIETSYTEQLLDQSEENKEKLADAYIDGMDALLIANEELGDVAVGIADARAREEPMVINNNVTVHANPEMNQDQAQEAIAVSESIADATAEAHAENTNINVGKDMNTFVLKPITPVPLEPIKQMPEHLLKRLEMERDNTEYVVPQKDQSPQEQNPEE